MSTLVDLAISAHGGMDRRKRLSTVSAHLRVGGRPALWWRSAALPAGQAPCAEAATAYRWWDQQGQPPIEAWQWTVTAHRQRISLA
jgi:hypothetical protein